MPTSQVAAIITRVMATDREELLLQKKDLDYVPFPGKWCLFGGAIEQGESADAAIRRELREEFGYRYLRRFLFARHFRDFRLRRQYGADELNLGSGTDHKVYVYTCRLRIENPPIFLLEGAGYAFFSQSEILGDYKDLIEEHHFRIIADYFK